MSMNMPKTLTYLQIQRKFILYQTMKAAAEIVNMEENQVP